MNDNKSMLVFRLAVLLFLSCLLLPATGGFLARIHYLGHAAFVIEFGNGVKVLTDYGQTNAYGLDSPIHGLGTLKPDVVTISHGHVDHAGGTLPAGVPHVLRNGQSLELKGLSIRAIPTYERSLDSPDNFAYLFSFRGLSILHAGDCQALIKNVHTPKGRNLIQVTYPGIYDLLLMPIGFIDDIIQPAIAFLELLHPRQAIPMHYWSPASKEAFLALLETHDPSRAKRFAIKRSKSARLNLIRSRNDESRIMVLSLLPEPFVDFEESIFKDKVNK